MKKEQIEVVGASVPFFRYEKDGIVYFEFNTAECEPPEPMANAMRGLMLLNNSSDRLRMINMQEPTGLYPTIADRFSWSVDVLENDNMSIIFRS